MSATIVAGVFEVPAAVLNWLYAVTNSYTLAIALVAVIVMAIVTPLTLKSTKGMLEMQRLGPEMRRLQQEYRHDRQQPGRRQRGLRRRGDHHPGRPGGGAQAPGHVHRRHL